MAVVHSKCPITIQIDQLFETVNFSISGFTILAVFSVDFPMLDIDPGAYKAETDTRVQIRIGSRSLTATGMLALLQENRLELKSNVSGKFVP